MPLQQTCVGLSLGQISLPPVGGGVVGLGSVGTARAVAARARVVAAARNFMVKSEVVGSRSEKAWKVGLRRLMR